MRIQKGLGFEEETSSSEDEEMIEWQIITISDNLEEGENTENDSEQLLENRELERRTSAMSEDLTK